MTFKKTLDLQETANPSNHIEDWLVRDEMSLQDKHDYPVFYLEKTRNGFSAIVKSLLERYAVIDWEFSDELDKKRFLRDTHLLWPFERSKNTFESNLQGTQPLHFDNTEPGDPRRWNFFANTGERGAKTLVMNRELFGDYQGRFEKIAVEVKKQLGQVRLEEVETTTPIHPVWFKQFMEGSINPSYNLESFYWFLEILTKLYRGQNFCKEALDALYAEIIDDNESDTFVKDWEKPGGLIHDNTKTIHGRYCPDTLVMPEDEAANVVRLWIGERKKENELARAINRPVNRDGQGILQEWVTGYDISDD